MENIVLAEGMNLLYARLHGKHFSYREKETRNLAIFYCLQGRMEWLDGDCICSIEMGDLWIKELEVEEEIDFRLPLGSGKTLAYLLNIENMETFFKHLPEELSLSGDCIKDIRGQFLKKKNWAHIKTNETIRAIWRPLKDQNHWKSLGMLKCLELLVYLRHTHQVEETKKKYFYRGQIEKVKGIHDQLVGHLGQRFTIEKLARENDISMTTLKDCFKYLFGAPIDTYMRRYRIHMACERLKNTKDAIADIAEEVGYESPSRFSSAFKRIVGMKPSEYRKQ